MSFNSHACFIKLIDLLRSYNLSTDFWFSKDNDFKVELAKCLLTQLKTSKFS